MFCCSIGLYPICANKDIEYTNKKITTCNIGLLF